MTSPADVQAGDEGGRVEGRRGVNAIRGHVGLEGQRARGQRRVPGLRSSAPPQGQRIDRSINSSISASAPSPPLLCVILLRERFYVLTHGERIGENCQKFLPKFSTWYVDRIFHLCI